MDEFEQKLKQLFDAQDFFRNPGLEAVIKNASIPEESIRSLDDDELEFLFAAGDLLAVHEKEDGRGNEESKK